jgi:thioredoxin-related protein
MRKLLTYSLLLVALLASPVAAAKLGEDGLHKQPWFTITFKDLREDLAAAKEAGKRLAIIVEQRGCLYCKKMHETVFSDEKVAKYISDNFMMVQYNMFGDEEVVDLDGKTLTEKTAVRRWGLAFTPTIMFFAEDAPEGKTAKDAAVQIMPGAFSKDTVLHMFQWVKQKGYEGEEPFQKYHARKLAERQAK